MKMSFFMMLARGGAVPFNLADEIHTVIDIVYFSAHDAVVAGNACVIGFKENGAAVIYFAYGKDGFDLQRESRYTVLPMLGM